MTIAKEFLHKATSVAFRCAAFAVLGAGGAATLAFANDDAPEKAAPTAWNSPPPEFSPMTSHERLGNYVSGLGSFESLVRSQEQTDCRSGWPKIFRKSLLARSGAGSSVAFVPAGKPPNVSGKSVIAQIASSSCSAANSRG